MNWSAPTAHGWPRDRQQPLDPYVQWAEASRWRGYTSQAQFRRPTLARSWITFMAELTPSAAANPLQAIAGLSQLRAPEVPQPDQIPNLLYIPNAYRQPAPGALVGTRFFTGRIRHRHLRLLHGIDAIARWELAQPVGRPDPSVVGTDREHDTTRVASDVPTAVRDRLVPRSQTDQDSQRDRLIGIIDSGCAFLHPAFRDDHGATRIVQFWDQGIARRHGRRNWSTASHFGYGSVLWHDDIDRLLTLHLPSALGQADDEIHTYEALQHMLRQGRVGRPVRRAMHGTHVLDVAGGRRDPWNRGAAPDAASSAPLAFVQLPRRTAADGTGGALGAHLLDGVRQLMTLVDADGDLVISISQGTQAGPHDGSSMIESALDELLELRPNNFAIVVGAGNARLSDCHAVASVPPGQTVELALHIPHLDSTDSFAECWYPRADPNGQPHRLSLQAVAPDGPVSPRLFTGYASRLVGGARSTGPAVAMLIHESAVPGGADAMALLALSPASADDGQPPNPRRHAPCGTWTLRIRNEGTEPCVVDAWAERDEPVHPPWNDFPRWRVGRAGVTTDLAPPTPRGTLNTLATAQHVLVAGALVKASRRPSPYSSLGPPRGGPRLAAGLPTPNVLAAADASTQLPGVRAAAVRGGDTVRMRGTSVAAPTLARQLFNVLVAAPHPVHRRDWQNVIDRLADPADTESCFMSTPPTQEPTP